MTDTPLAEHIEIYRDESGEYRWRAKAGNNETVADSGEGYVHHSWCLEAVQRLFPDARIVDYDWTGDTDPTDFNNDPTTD